MRCYLVDELQPEVIASLEAQLTKRGCQSGIERLYWLPLEKERLLPVQREHESSCGPHCLALEILDDAVRLEFLVRAKGRMRCECVCYLSPEAERHMMDWLDARIMEAEIEQDINPMECGQERCAPGHSFGPGVREYYLLHYVLSGVGRFTVNGTAHTLHAGDIFVIRPFERIYYEADAEAPWHYVWAGFEASVPLPEALSQDVIRCPDARAVFLEMLEAGKLEQGRERCLCGRIWLLLSMLEHMESAGPRGSDYVLRAVNWMQTNYMNPVSISALAGELNLDRSYFSTLFRRQTGRSPQQYLTELRLEKARTLLLEYGYRPGEAAQAVGYADIFSFSRMFKRRYGVSPSALRR